MSFSTSRPSKLFFKLLISNRLITASFSLPVITHLFLRLLHDKGHKETEHIVDQGRYGVGDHVGLPGRKGLGLVEQLHDRQGEGKRCVLHKRDGLVRDGGHHPLDDLGQDDPHKSLGLAVAQDLGRLILSLGHGLDPASVYLRKIGRIVERKSKYPGQLLPGVCDLHVFVYIKL